jgi:hypothetical protein
MGITWQRHLLLLVGSKFYKATEHLLMMLISTCRFVSHLPFTMSFHIVVGCVVFMVISLCFGKGLLFLSYCEL